MSLPDHQLKFRKDTLEERLRTHGIGKYSVTYLPYVDESKESLREPVEAGKRLMILYAVSAIVHEMHHREKLITWLKAEKLWEQTSPKEKDLLNGILTDEKSLIDFSWKIESAYLLAWTLGIVEVLPPPSNPIPEENLDELEKHLPEIGSDLSAFLDGLSYIDKSEIYIENLFNELATTHFRDLFLNGQSNTSDIKHGISYERHKTLNWLRRFGDSDSWDEVDTST